MKQLLHRLCGKGTKHPESNQSPTSPIQVNVNPEGEISHVRFQDSDLDELEHIENPQMVEDNPADLRVQSDSGNVLPGISPQRPIRKKDTETDEDNQSIVSKVPIGYEDDEEDPYSRVEEDPGLPDARHGRDHRSSFGPRVTIQSPRQASHTSHQMPTLRAQSLLNVSRWKNQSHANREPHIHHGKDEITGFDWISGIKEGADSSRDQSVILKNMVVKLSKELSKKQFSKSYKGLDMEQFSDQEWLFQFGALVPLLVAYEEEIKEIKNTNAELERNVISYNEKLQELLMDNQEMAKRLKDIASAAPYDPEEIKILKESAALVLEENELLKDMENDLAEEMNRREKENKENFDMCLEEKNEEIFKLEESVSNLRRQVSVLTGRNNQLEEEVAKYIQNKEIIVSTVPEEKYVADIRRLQSELDQEREQFKRDMVDKMDTIRELQRELSRSKLSIDEKNSLFIKCDVELKLNKKLVRKFEETAENLQHRLLQLTREKSEALEESKRAKSLVTKAVNDAERAKDVAFKAQAALRSIQKKENQLLSSSQLKTEDLAILENLQAKIKDIKSSLGQKVKSLESEVLKGEERYLHFKERKESQIRELQLELKLQSQMVERLVEDKRRLNMELKNLSS